jgi:putative oxygen-independent coproporphyrinogen III oxidase
MAGIYLHIPLCKKLCSYCDFYHVISSADNSAFIDAIRNEAAQRKEYLRNEIVSTVYFGGGTPSVLSVEELELIMTDLKSLYTISDDCEITAELNPDDITHDYAKALSQIGFNRVSMGVQSWRDSDLKMLNRRHDSAQAERALLDLINAGFENISIDLIYGIPGMGQEVWINNLERSFSYGIKHLSAYHLTIEPGTVFGKMHEKGILNEIDEEESITLFNLLIEKAEKAGFIHYEISNFGQPGYFSRHNSNYWKQINYLGLGPSAHSFNGYSRQWNVRDLRNYIKLVNSGKPYFEREDLDLKARFNEYIMTSLRTMWGIDLEYIEQTFEKEGYDYVVNLSGKFKDYGLIKQDANHLVLTNQGKIISDNIISEFMIPGEE